MFVLKIKSELYSISPDFDYEQFTNECRWLDLTDRENPDFLYSL